MESWSYKDFVPNESVHAPKDDGSTGWESNNGPCSFGTNSNLHEPINYQGFVHLGFQDLMRKSLSNSSIRDVLGNNVYSCENKSSLIESNCRDSALIGLKLGRFADLRETHNLNSLNSTHDSSLVESSVSVKRVRVRNTSSSIPFCRVQGCKKDLSSSKDYHKKHKVCELHSKTAIVIVNGIEQRFCQQCSRFHLLLEFDYGKRSCRKRLAGHNERRRKPHVGIHYRRTGRSFQSFNGI